jgi:hypothetical protein
MRVCYLIQSHKNPQQIYRLVNVIKKSSPDSYVLITHNYDSCHLDTTPLENLSGVQVISNKVTLGDLAIINAYLNSIQWLFDNNIEFDWLVNLSGQDYPTQPLTKMEKLLSETSYDGFVEYFPAISPNSENPWGARKGHERYFYHYRTLRSKLPTWQRILLKPIKEVINNSQPFIRIECSYGLKVGLKNHQHPFTENFVCYGGSYWFAISRKCVEFLKDSPTKYPELFDYYEKTYIPDESIFQTLLVNNPLFNLCNINDRYVDYANSRHGHPRVLTSEDFPALTNENINFARKFDMTLDSKVLDLLDERIFAV